MNRIPEQAIIYLVGAAAARYLEHDALTKEKRAELRAASAQLLAQFTDAVDYEHATRETFEDGTGRSYTGPCDVPETLSGSESASEPASAPPAREPMASEPGDQAGGGPVG